MPSKARPSESPSETEPRKRGAPVGHPGWFRPTPTKYDVLVEVAAPPDCPHCGGPVSVYTSQDPADHLQEDLVAGRRHVTLFRHPQARCRSCRRWVQKAGEGEIVGSMIGPRLRAVAVYLHTSIGISLRKVPRAIADLFEFHFTPAALIGFERLLATDALPVVDDIRKKIAASDGAVHADETYWTLDGERAYYWLHATRAIHPLSIRHHPCRRSLAGSAGSGLRGHLGHRLLFGLRRPRRQGEAKMLVAPGPYGARLAETRPR